MEKSNGINFVPRILLMLVALFFASIAMASAAVNVNKSFNPTSIAVGANSTVTITLQNTSTASAATITAFRDDLSTMGGTATIAATPALSTTCAGGAPSISGQVITMNSGTIPAAPSGSQAGTCTITFAVTGQVAGNGTNTIPAGTLQTNQGSNATAAAQTLQVVGTTGVSASATPSKTVYNTAPASQTLSVTNNGNSPLTNLQFPIVTSDSLAVFYQISVTLSGCSGGTAAYPTGSSRSTKRITVSGVTLAPGATCSATVTVSGGQNVTLDIGAGSVTDTQAVTNPSAATTSIIFVEPRPYFAKAFSPNSVAPGGKTRVSIALLGGAAALTHVAYNDVLPQYLTVDPLPNVVSTGCGAPITGGAGTRTFSASGMTIAAGATCTVTFTVDVSPLATQGTVTNVIPAASVSDDQGFHAINPATASLAISTLAIQKMFPRPNTITRGISIPLTVTITNNSALPATGGSFTDNLPQTPTQPLNMVVGAGASRSSNCGNPTISAAAGSTSYSVTNISVAPNSACTVIIPITYSTGAASVTSDSNTILGANVKFTIKGLPASAGNDTSDYLVGGPAYRITNYNSTNVGPTNRPLSMQGSILCSIQCGVADTNVKATFVMNPAGAHDVKVTGPVTFGSNCPSGLTAANVVFGANNESFTVNIPSLSTNCTVNYQVINEVPGAVGQFGVGLGSYTSTENNGTTPQIVANTSATFVQGTLAINKTFTPGTIAANGTAALNVNVFETSTFAYTDTGVTIVDPFPAGLTLVGSATGTPTFSPECRQAGQPAPQYTFAGGVLTFTNVSVLSQPAASTPCSLSVNVTSSAVGNVVNTIAAGSASSNGGATNGQAASASLSVVQGLALTKSFLQPTLAVGGTDYVRFVITNTSNAAVVGSLTDNMPASLSLQVPQVPLGAQPGDPVACNGTIGGSGQNVMLSGMNVPAASSPSAPGQCVQYVEITTTPNAKPGTVTNTILTGQLSTTNGLSNSSPASATVTLSTPPNVVLTKQFAPSSIASGSTSTVILNFANAAPGAVNLTNVGIVDTLPAGMTATGSLLSSTCGGTVTSTPGSIRLTGGSVGAGKLCAVFGQVRVTAKPGSYTNMVPAAVMTSDQGATNNAASATLTVTGAPNVLLLKSFLPASIPSGAQSSLKITIANTAPGAANLTNVSVSDVLPAGLAVVGTPVSTCLGPVSFSGNTISVSGGSISAGGSCDINAMVTATAPGTYRNDIPAGALQSDQGATNTPASATLTVTPATGVTLTKTFSPSSIVAGGNSTVTISIANAGAGATALTGMSLSDVLPSGVIATGTGATTCVGGSVSVNASGAALSGGTLAPNATCSITFSVTAPSAGSYVNDIPAGALTDTQGATNADAKATLTVSTPSGVTLTKSFSPSSITVGANSTLTITIANTGSGAAALSNMSLTDALPNGLATVGSPASTCAGGSATATTSSVSLTAGSLAVNGTCTITVGVTASSAGTYINDIPAGALKTAQGVSNQNATATLQVLNAPNVLLSKSFAAASIVPNTNTVLTITIANTAPSAAALTNVKVTDALPTGLTTAGTPATTCGGTATATSGSVTLAGGALAPNASCTITVAVTSATAGTYTNLIPAGALTSAQGASNADAKATLQVVNAPNVSLGKSFAPASIVANTNTVLTITIANTAQGSAALTNVKVTDALPTGVTTAGTPATTCGGTATATSGSVTLAGGTLAPNASCTITVAVTSATAGTYTNLIPAGALTSTQGASNADATATLTVTAALPNLTISKTSNPEGASVNAGQTITYTISIMNTGNAPETNAHISDVLGNATLVSNSVQFFGPASSVGTSAPDSVVTAAAPFGTIPVGATVRLTYSATVGTNLAAGALVTNSVTVGGDQPCTGICTAASKPNSISAPILSAVKLIDGKPSESVLAGQAVSYSISITNSGGSTATNTTISDTIPNGISADPSTVTLNGSPVAGATLNGQVLAIPVGSIARGATAIVAFQARITTAVAGSTLVNIAAVTADATSPVNSTPATANVQAGSLRVTKTANVTTAKVGDRIDYTVTVQGASAIPWGATTLVDSLPAYESYGTGTARINGVAVEPTISGNTLTWNVSGFTGTLTLTYSTVVRTGAVAGETLTNTISARAVPAGGGTPALGQASASVQVSADTFGTCYPITGRVYVDLMGTGRFVEGDKGLEGVRIYLEDGTSVVTDAEGRYNFPCTHPGMHALRLDKSTLPPGVGVYSDGNVDSERSTKRLVHHIFDATIIEDINFALKPRSPQP